MEIRRAAWGDTDGLLSLLSQVLEIHHKGRPDLFKGGAVKYTREELTELLGDERAPIFVAVDGEKLLGYCFCRYLQMIDNNILTDIKTLYIDDICVDETARGKHVGQQLYRFTEDYARSQGCYNVTLNVWECNPGARAFYEAMGMDVQKTGMEKIL